MHAGERESTPAALTKLSAMRLRRGWPRSKKPPFSKLLSSSSNDLVSKLLLLLIFLFYFWPDIILQLIKA